MTDWVVGSEDEGPKPMPDASMFLPLYPALPTPDAIIITRRVFPFEIIHVNLAWEKLCHFTAYDAKGQTCAILQGPETDKRTVAVAVSTACIEGHAVMTVKNYKQGSFLPFLNRVELTKVMGRNDLMMARLSEVPDLMLTSDSLTYRATHGRHWKSHSFLFDDELAVGDGKDF
jgi:hypothetical protein